MEKPQRGIETRLIHAGEPSPRIGGAVSMPIFQSSTFESAGAGDYHALRYIRLNNTPNHLALHQKLAAIESAEAALVAGSGMAAISATLLTLLGRGDHLLAQDCLYGGTHDLLTAEFTRLGIAHTLLDGARPETWEAALRPTTKVFYLETISNPLMRLPDFAAAVEFVRAHRLISIIDNTFASPINFRPAEVGFDLSLHSATKYLNGHSDIVAGAVIGRAALVERINRTLGHLGGALDPHACFLLDRGLKTLAVRVRHQNQSAAALAEFLRTDQRVARVNYPGLQEHPEHARALKYFEGCGGMISFELRGGQRAADAFIDAARIPICAPSLGGVESLITRPAATSHSGLTPAARAAMRISDGLIRYSVGLETTADLIDDCRAALAVV